MQEKEKKTINTKDLLKQISQFLRANPPDKDTCESWVGRLKNDKNRGPLIYREDHTMVWSFYFFWYACFHSGRGGLDYATFSHEELGQRIARSRWGVARAIKGLARQGFLRSYRRKHKRNGKWETNRYLIGIRAWYFVLNWLKSHYPVFFRKKSNPFLQKPWGTNAPQEPHKEGSIRIHEGKGGNSRDSGRTALDPCQDLAGPSTSSGNRKQGYGGFMGGDDSPVQDLQEFRRRDLRESTPVLSDRTQEGGTTVQNPVVPETKWDGMDLGLMKREVENLQRTSEDKANREGLDLGLFWQWQHALVAFEARCKREGIRKEDVVVPDTAPPLVPVSSLPMKTKFESTFDWMTVEKMREEVVRLYTIWDGNRRSGKEGKGDFWNWKNVQIVFNNRCIREGREELKFGNEGDVRNAVEIPF